MLGAPSGEGGRVNAASGGAWNEGNCDCEKLQVI